MNNEANNCYCGNMRQSPELIALWCTRKNIHYDRKSKHKASKFTDNKFEVVQVLNSITKLGKFLLLQRVFAQLFVLNIH